MKKIVCILSAVSCILSLYSCGDNTSESFSSQNNVSETTVSQSVTETTVTTTVTENTTTILETTTFYTTSSESSDTGDLNSLGDIKVEERLFDVTLTIPADLVSDPEKSISEANEDEGIKSCILNEDGSLTYVMTKEAHEKMVNEVKSSCIQGIQDSINNTYQTITDITYNDNFTEFTVYVTDEASFKNNYSDRSVSIALYMNTYFYNVFSGMEYDENNIPIHYIDNSTGTGFTL